MNTPSKNSTDHEETKQSGRKRLESEQQYQQLKNRNSQLMVSMAAQNSLDIKIASDVICPWCFIGKRRLDKAIQSLSVNYDIHVTWVPFELNPNMPKQGMDRKSYRSAKFGNRRASQTLDARLTEVGLAEEISFGFDLIKITPNSSDAHRLVWLAQRDAIPKVNQLVDLLFQSYFVKGLDIGDRATLAQIAEDAAGLEKDKVRLFLESNEGVVEIGKEESKVHRMGIKCVPSFIINNAYCISGAQSPKTLISAFNNIMNSHDLHASFMKI